MADFFREGSGGRVVLFNVCVWKASGMCGCGISYVYSARIYKKLSSQFVRLGGLRGFSYKL